MTNPQNSVNLTPLTTVSSAADQRTDQLVQAIFQAADDRKGADIQVLRVTEVSYLTDYFVIVTGFSRTQVKAIADAIIEKGETLCHKSPLRVEGMGESNWVVVDYGDVIAHIFLPSEREFYNLEAFWGHAQRVDVSSFNSVN